MDKCSSHPRALGQEFGLQGLGQPGNQPKPEERRAHFGWTLNQCWSPEPPCSGSRWQHSEAESARNQEQYGAG